MGRETEYATFAGGCFWCTEAAFEQLNGVSEVTSGYCGGHVEDPTYREVCSGNTGHAEAIRLAYDPDAVSYPELLRVFFTVHDPTTLDRQGPDVGTQYRSAVFYHDERQRELAAEFIADLEESGAYDDGIVTELEPLETFYEAEPEHQDYYEKNPNDRYCAINADPKIRKVREEFEERVKQEAE
jgi:peptide-methionine (S)-S-oxide reductase